jgi:membrane protein
LSFGLIFGLAFLLIVSLVASAAIAALGRWTSMLPAGESVLLVTNFALSMGITTLLFASIYKLMPRAHIDWRDVWVGALVTALLFEAGKLLIGLYLGKTGVASSFGAAGSLAVLLVWVYYSAQVFLLGAEFTWGYANQHGSLAGQETDAVSKPA